MWFLFLLACRSDSVCSGEKQPSLFLHFVDGNGAKAIPDKVEWYHNDAAMGEISQLDSDLKIGSELTGNFYLIVSAGGQSQNYTYTVNANECGVLTIEDQIQILSAIECDELVLPSVIVSAKSVDGETLIMDEVQYTLDGGETEQATCWNDCSEWIVGTEMVGGFDITGYYFDGASGNLLEEKVEIQVDADECNVITQEVVLYFDVTVSDQECDDSVDEGWLNYFDSHIGCGDLSLFSTMEGGYQQLQLEVPDLYNLLEVNQPYSLSFSDDDIELFLQFGEDLDQFACSNESEQTNNVDFEYTAKSGTVTVTLKEESAENYTISAVVQDTIMESTNECTILLENYSWDEITVAP
jgi:hypothetical protein